MAGREGKFCLVAEGERARESGMSRAEQQGHLPMLHKMTQTVKPVTKRKERGKHMNRDCESPLPRAFPNWPRAGPVQSRNSGWSELALVANGPRKVGLMGSRIFGASDWRMLGHPGGYYYSRDRKLQKLTDYLDIPEISFGIFSFQFENDCIFVVTFAQETPS